MAAADQMALALTGPARATNRPPVVTWTRAVMACSTVRHRLQLDGRVTPYFVDVAKTRAHYTLGHKVGLFGAGLGAEIRCREGGTYRIAATLGVYDRLGLAKARAERLALST